MLTDKYWSALMLSLIMRRASRLAFWPVIHRLCELLMGILNFKFWTKRYSLDFVCVTQNCVHLFKFVSKRFFPSAFRDSLKNFFNFPAMSFCGEHISLFEFLQVNIGNSTPRPRQVLNFANLPEVQCPKSGLNIRWKSHGFRPEPFINLIFN